MTTLKWPFLISFSRFLQAALMISLSTLSANTVLAAPDNKMSKLQCTGQGEIAKFDGSKWVCAADENTQRPAPSCFSDGVTDPDEDGNGRYFDCGNGTVTDTVTGLVLLQNAICFGEQSWVDANQSAASLGEGQCGLTDGSSPGDWRVMTKEEWEATVDRALINDCGGVNGPSLTDRGGSGCFANDPLPVFSGVQTDSYWSSTTTASQPGFAEGIFLFGGGFNDNKPSFHFVWPVRDGQ